MNAPPSSMCVMEDAALIQRAVSLVCVLLDSGRLQTGRAASVSWTAMDSFLCFMCIHAGMIPALY